jgi:hypothetical protein
MNLEHSYPVNHILISFGGSFMEPRLQDYFLYVEIVGSWH